MRKKVASRQAGPQGSPGRAKKFWRGFLPSSKGTKGKREKLQPVLTLHMMLLNQPDTVQGDNGNEPNRRCWGTLLQRGVIDFSLRYFIQGCGEYRTVRDCYEQKEG